MLLIDLFKRIYHKQNKSKDEEISINCIKCGDTKQHLGINFRKNLFNCFKCGFAGSVDYLAKIMFDVDTRNFIKYKAKAIKSIKTNKTKIELPADFKRLDDIYYLPISKSYTTYLINRHISLQQIKKYKIGISLRERKGLIIFPVYDVHNKQVYWTSRSLLSYGGKTYNPVSTDDEVSKSDVLLNIQNAVKYDDVVITEGPFDFMSYGDNAVALLGKVISDVQYKMLKKLKFKKYILALDNDAKEKMFKYAKTMLSDIGNKIYYVKYPDSRDLNDLLIDDDLDKIKIMKFGGLNIL